MTLFEETQRFDQWWIKVILFIPVFEVLATMLNEYQTLGVVGNNSLIALAVVACVVMLLVVMNLHTRINETGISFCFFPFHIKPQQIRWDEVEVVYIREYNALTEYGGWGIRGLFGDRKAYNVKGNIGLQLVLRDGKKILFGTSDRQRLANALEQLQQDRIISVLSS
jgi:hypothetical protein